MIDHWEAQARTQRLQPKLLCTQTLAEKIISIVDRDYATRCAIKYTIPLQPLDLGFLFLGCVSSLDVVRHTTVHLGTLG